MCAPEKSLCVSCTDKTCGAVDPRFSSGAKTVLYEELVDKISKEVLSSIKAR
jgi:hypothetical protein